MAIMRELGTVLIKGDGHNSVTPFRTEYGNNVSGDTPELSVQNSEKKSDTTYMTGRWTSTEIVFPVVLFLMLMGIVS